MSNLEEIKSAEMLLFSHYLRTGERLFGESAVRFLELKFNQRHYRENGQFARAGEGMHYGGRTVRLGSVGAARQSRTTSSNVISAPGNGSSRDTAKPHHEIVVIGDRDKQLLDDFDAAFAASEARRVGQPSLRPLPNYQLGDLSASEESGPRPMPGLVSTGRGDDGGVSYGPWQLATNRQQPQAFLASAEGRRWARQFAGKIPGAEEFSRTWKEVARLDAHAFYHAQRRYIGQSHYDEGLKTIRNDTGIDLSQSGRTIQDVIWSRSVQLGPRTGAFKKAIDLTSRQLNGVKRESYEWSSQFIKNVYAESGRRNAKGAMVYFTRSPTLWPSLARRFGREERAAQSMLSYEWGRN